MLNITPVKKAYIALALTLCAIGGIVVVVLLPTLSGLREVKRQIFEIHASIEQQHAQLQRIHRASVKLPEIKAAVQHWQHALITPETQLQFIRFMEGLAQLNALELNIDAQPFDNEQNPHLKKGLRLDVRLVGPFESTMDFLSQFEQSDYYSFIEYIDLQRLESFGNDNAAVALATTVRAVMYLH